jgi:hypothetical protein
MGELINVKKSKWFITHHFTLVICKSPVTTDFPRDHRIVVSQQFF